MGACCSKYGEGGEKLGCKVDMEEEEEEEKEENENRLKYHHQFDESEEVESVRAGERGARVRLKGSSGFASMYSQQGWKGTNQDAMTVWEDFGGSSDSAFCGMFDGHGLYGHRVAGYVRDKLPSKLSAGLDSLPHLQEDDRFRNESVSVSVSGDDDNVRNGFSSWKGAFLKAFEELDKELRSHASFDCVCSGSTAVSIVKQREHLIIANLGDSRAILATRDDKNQPVAVQLTVDLKPNLPSEVERITKCRGRVFALDEEPDVHRIWMPNEDCPGLAMARAFGDFCLKDFGLISTPQVTCRKISDKDEFVVLATDGVWDVLTNKEVIKIVSSASKRSDAAKHLVERAVRAWRFKHPTSKVDDCTAICFFLKQQPEVPLAKQSFHNRWHSARSCQLSSESFKSARSGDFSEVEVGPVTNKEERTALEGASSANSLMHIPRSSRTSSRRRRSAKSLEQFLLE